jgi:hypothetical protein
VTLVDPDRKRLLNGKRTPVLTGQTSTRERPRLPKWFVSSPHKIQIYENGQVATRPWGLAHAREVGSPRTACGEAASTWHIFWDSPFSAHQSLVCEQCILGVENL